MPCDFRRIFTHEKQIPFNANVCIQSICCLGITAIVLFMLYTSFEKTGVAEPVGMVGTCSIQFFWQFLSLSLIWVCCVFTSENSNKRKIILETDCPKQIFIASTTPEEE